MYFFNKVLYSMTKSALKMYLSAVSMFLISGCTYSSDALFPSLFGSDAQEEMAAGDGGFSDEAVPPAPLLARKSPLSAANWPSCRRLSVTTTHSSSRFAVLSLTMRFSIIK